MTSCPNCRTELIVIKGKVKLAVQLTPEGRPHPMWCCKNCHRNDRRPDFFTCEECKETEPKHSSGVYGSCNHEESP